MPIRVAPQITAKPLRAQGSYEKTARPDALCVMRAQWERLACLGLPGVTFQIVIKDGQPIVVIT